MPWASARWVVVIGLLDMVGNAAFILAAQAGDLAIAATLSSLYPVGTVLLAIAILHERLIAQPRRGNRAHRRGDPADRAGDRGLLAPAYDHAVRISAKVDYAVRAMCELAAHDGATPLKAEQMAAAQEIPLSFLENILVDLKRAELVRSLRGQVGGYRLGRPGGGDLDRGHHPRGRGAAGRRPRRPARGACGSRAPRRPCATSGSPTGSASGACSST